MKVAEVQLIYKTNVKACDRPKVESSYDAFNIFWEHYDHETIEHVESCYLLILNRANKVLGCAKLSTGGVSSCIMDVKVIFQHALKANASGIIICHNHPSGNLRPSDADVQVTRKIKEAGKLLDIELLDSLIITPERTFYSFADDGRI